MIANNNLSKSDDRSGVIIPPPVIYVAIFAIGFFTAFVCALIVVRPFVRFISRHGFGAFAWYRIALGALALALLLMR